MGSGSRGGVRGTQDPCPPPLFLDQTEAWQETPPPPILGPEWPSPPSPLSKGLDSPLYVLQVKIKFGLKFFHLGWFSISFVS